MSTNGNGSPSPEKTREVDELIDGLGDARQDVLDASRERLLALGSEELSAFTSGVTRALQRLPIGHAALPELPWLLFDLGKPDELTIDAVKQLLASADTGVVSVTMDMIVELKNPSLAGLIAPLQSDERYVSLRGSKKTFTVGAYAKGALDRLLLPSESR